MTVEELQAKLAELDPAAMIHVAATGEDVTFEIGEVALAEDGSVGIHIELLS